MSFTTEHLSKSNQGHTNVQSLLQSNTLYILPGFYSDKSSRSFDVLFTLFTTALPFSYFPITQSLKLSAHYLIMLIHPFCSLLMSLSLFIPHAVVICCFIKFQKQINGSWETELVRDRDRETVGILLPATRSHSYCAAWIWVKLL